jgi:D-galactose 1-dehydrogenase
MPLAAELGLSTGRVPVTASFDWRREGTEIWSIEVETEGGALLLSDGGASLTIGSQSHAFSPEEYAGVYKRFRHLIADAALDADLAPLNLVLEALKEGAPSPSPD